MSINIRFDNPYAVYHPGTDVVGVVVLDLDEEIKARAVSISVSGLARTHWTETIHTQVTQPDGTNETAMVTQEYESSITYATGEATVWTDGPNKNRLPAGHHEFPFRFRLPDNCSPSFEGSNGFIRYQVSVEIDRKWWFNKTNRKSFTVAPTFDLNRIPQAFAQILRSETKNTGVILFRNGKFTVNMNIPKTGFVPGETISIFCDVTNDSSKPVTNAEVKLHQLIRYSAQWARYTSTKRPFGIHERKHNTKKNEDKVAAIAEQNLEIAPKSHSAFQLDLVVPPTVSTLGADRCPIIIIEYYLTVKFWTTSMNSTIRFEAPVLIGTIPVAVHATAPPCYEETVFGSKETTIDIANDEPFAPRYPVFYNLPPPDYTPSAPPE